MKCGCTVRTMQAASRRLRQKDCLVNDRDISPFCIFESALFSFLTKSGRFTTRNPKHTPLELLALLLLALPSLLTLQKLLVLPELGERSHHQFALPDDNKLYKMPHVFISNSCIFARQPSLLRLSISLHRPPALPTLLLRVLTISDCFAQARQS